MSCASAFRPPVSSARKSNCQRYSKRYIACSTTISLSEHIHRSPFAVLSFVTSIPNTHNNRSSSLLFPSLILSFLTYVLSNPPPSIAPPNGQPSPWSVPNASSRDPGHAIPGPSSSTGAPQVSFHASARVTILSRVATSVPPPSASSSLRMRLTRTTKSDALYATISRKTPHASCP